MRAMNRSGKFCAALAAAVIISGATACQQGTTVETTSSVNNANTANTTVVTTSSPTNANTSPMMDAGIETREPERYRATVMFSAEAQGKPQALALPIEVARDGDNRLYAFNNVPLIGRVAFLDRADKRYLILPARKQYAELSAQTVGFDVRSLTPGQMVAQLQKQRGLERVGEEQRDGRTVIKYRYAATA